MVAYRRTGMHVDLPRIFDKHSLHVCTILYPSPRPRWEAPGDEASYTLDRARQTTRN